MPTKFRLVLGSALVLALAAGSALAGPGHHGGRGGRAQMKEKFDLNKDGKLDDAERAKAHEAFKAKHAEMKAKKLAEFDANRNGKLDDVEKSAMHAQRKVERFKKLDANNDGKITMDEFQAAKRGGKR